MPRAHCIELGTTLSTEKVRHNSARGVISGRLAYKAVAELTGPCPMPRGHQPVLDQPGAIHGPVMPNCPSSVPYGLSTKLARRRRKQYASHWLTVSRAPQWRIRMGQGGRPLSIPVRLMARLIPIVGAVVPN